MLFHGNPPLNAAKATSGLFWGRALTDPLGKASLFHSAVRLKAVNVEMEMRDKIPLTIQKMRVY
ncbi:hypothetical protein B1693_14740 [Geobacillus zalihae]|nr:hypothetical protein B1693_14740 [Geobacillus zalihae]